MPGATTGQIQRAIRGLTLGTVKSYDAAKVRSWETAMDEFDQQFQLPVSGTIDARGVWVPIDVSFDVTMISSPDRGNELSSPLFTYGVEFITGRPFITVGVTRWSASGEVGIGGASLEVGAFMPGARKLTTFAATVHLNFQGFGSPNPLPDEVDEDEEADLSGAADQSSGEVVDTDLTSFDEDPPDA